MKTQLIDPVQLTKEELECVMLALREMFTPDSAFDQMFKHAESALRKFRSAKEKLEIRNKERQEFFDTMVESEIELIKEFRNNLAANQAPDGCKAK